MAMAKKKARKNSAIRITLTKREREALDRKSGGNAKTFAKSVVLKSCFKELKDRGRSGNRTHPTESAPPAADKTAAPPGREQPSVSKRRTAKAKGRFDSPQEAWRILNTAELLAIRKVLESESDRGCLLVGHAVIDDALGNLLYRFFLREIDGTDWQTAEKAIRKLFSFEQVAGSFWARAQLCFACGLIDQALLSTLDG